MKRLNSNPPSRKDCSTSLGAEWGFIGLLERCPPRGSSKRYRCEDVSSIPVNEIFLTKK